MLKSRTMRFALAAITLAAFQGAYAATDTANISVAASIAKLCKLSLTGTTLDFGGLDVTSTADALLTDAITASYQCTKNTTVTATGFTVGGSSSGTFSGTLNTTPVSDTIPFSITWTQPGAFTAGGFGTTASKVTVPLSAKILNADYVTKVPGNYAASVAVVVTY